MKAILFIFGILVGATGLYFYYPHLPENMQLNKPKYTEQSAEVEKLLGVSVFVKCKPQKPYELISKFKDENALDILGGLGIGENRWDRVAENIFNAGTENLIFSNKLQKVVQNVKEKYPEAQGIIFYDNLSECEVIRFKGNSE